MHQSVGLIGVGAFGEFALPHLLPHCRVGAYDPHRDLSALTETWAVVAESLEAVAAKDVVILAMPVQRIRETCRRIAPYVKPGALVLDVCSVKEEPMAAMLEELPDHAAIVGTHPLFGPQTGADGVSGLRVAICEGRGGRLDCVDAFLSQQLKLTTLVTTAEEHDRQLALVQGLTHLLSRIIVEMDMPMLDHTTETFDMMMKMVESVRYDSDELFRAIENRNRFVRDARGRFFDAARVIEEQLSRPMADPD
ncbi:MAG: prephenate dehydrogenase [Alphaproteobacteria bacterium]|nr:prephenate dehydrogenase [Alphaproteobacteria bacterium]